MYLIPCVCSQCGGTIQMNKDGQAGACLYCKTVYINTNNTRKLTLEDIFPNLEGFGIDTADPAGYEIARICNEYDYSIIEEVLGVTCLIPPGYKFSHFEHILGTRVEYRVKNIGGGYGAALLVINPEDDAATCQTIVNTENISKLLSGKKKKSFFKKLLEKL